MRVLLIEDDAELAEAIAAGLRLEGMAVDVALDGDSGLDRATVHGYDVIALDRDLPVAGGDVALDRGFPVVRGDEVCARLVAQPGRRAWILMLAAAGTVEEPFGGSGTGADDYLRKPFAFAELITRIRALGHRPHTVTQAGLFRRAGRAAR
jgi:DNA-binding response OmpR family regulator